MYKYNTSSYTIDSDYINYRDKIKNLRTKLNKSQQDYNDEISNLNRSLENINNTQNDENSSIYLQNVYEDEKEDIEERLISNISNLLIELYTIFESTMKNIFLRHNVDFAGNNYFKIDKYYQYLYNELNIEISNNFKLKFKRFKNKRNQLTHNGVDSTYDKSELIDIINEITIEFEPLIIKIITEFKNKKG